VEFIYNEIDRNIYTRRRLTNDTALIAETRVKNAIIIVSVYKNFSAFCIIEIGPKLPAEIIWLLVVVSTCNGLEWKTANELGLDG